MVLPTALRERYTRGASYSALRAIYSWCFLQRSESDILMVLLTALWEWYTHGTSYSTPRAIYSWCFLQRSESDILMVLPTALWERYTHGASYSALRAIYSWFFIQRSESDILTVRGALRAIYSWYFLQRSESNILMVLPTALWERYTHGAYCRVCRHGSTRRPENCLQHAPESLNTPGPGPSHSTCPRVTQHAPESLNTPPRLDASLNWSVGPSFASSAHQSIGPPICPSIRPSIRPPVYPPTCPSVRLSVVRLSVRPSTRPMRPTVVAVVDIRVFADAEVEGGHQRSNVLCLGEERMQEGAHVEEACGDTRRKKEGIRQAAIIAWWQRIFCYYDNNILTFLLLPFQLGDI